MMNWRFLGVPSLTIAAGGFLLVIVTTFAPAPALAQSAAEQACTPDVMSLCSDLISEGNRGRIASCLRRNRSSLSAECRAVMGGKSSKAAKRRARRR